MDYNLGWAWPSEAAKAATVAFAVADALMSGEPSTYRDDDDDYGDNDDDFDDIILWISPQLFRRYAHKLLSQHLGTQIEEPSKLLLKRRERFELLQNVTDFFGWLKIIIHIILIIIFTIIIIIIIISVVVIIIIVILTLWSAASLVAGTSPQYLLRCSLCRIIQIYIYICIYICICICFAATISTHFVFVFGSPYQHNSHAWWMMMIVWWGMW